MFNISSFLEKVSKSINSQELDIQKICDVIFDKANVTCKPESIKIQNNILFINISPAVKNKIFINKQSILEVLSNSTSKIIDIR